VVARHALSVLQYAVTTAGVVAVPSHAPLITPLTQVLLAVLRPLMGHGGYWSARSTLDNVTVMHAAATCPLVVESLSSLSLFRDSALCVSAQPDLLIAMVELLVQSLPARTAKRFVLRDPQLVSRLLHVLRSALELTTDTTTTTTAATAVSAKTKGKSKMSKFEDCLYLCINLYLFLSCL
jgi:hypothetical protein